MIGFFFRNADRRRTQRIGVSVGRKFPRRPMSNITGRPLGKVHANHPIMGGHFARRRQILKETLEFHAVAE